MRRHRVEYTHGAPDKGNPQRGTRDRLPTGFPSLRVCGCNADLDPDGALASGHVPVAMSVDLGAWGMDEDVAKELRKKRAKAVPGGWRPNCEETLLEDLRGELSGFRENVNVLAEALATITCKNKAPSEKRLRM